MVEHVELLERGEALATLAEARERAAGGQGRVIFVTGEPGIGKTSLVARFAAELEPEARVLVGTCDDLTIPRPLGPVRDLAGKVAPALKEALIAGAAPHDIQTLLIAELERPPRPTVLVLEDVHWADGATVDAITVLGRRIASLPALLVLTFRSGEVPPGHPLQAALGAIRAQDSVVIELAPLSGSAVAALVGEAADEVYAATKGNPFYVTELLASPSAVALPATVANAVRGRAARLADRARRLVELVSVVPGRVSASLLDAVMPGWPGAAVEPERRQLLEVDASYVRFRHELARNAIRLSLPIAARRHLHARILEALLEADADPADVVHHAEAAGAEEVVAGYALVAARRATALESNREAYSHYRRAADFVDRLPPLEGAVVLEELAMAAYAARRNEEAFPPLERATAIFRELRDRAGVGRCTRFLSRLLWFAGEGAAARARAHEAVDILEPLGESVELARAYSGLSQLAMLQEDLQQALSWGQRALDLATALGDERTRAHALVNIGTARLGIDPDESTTLVEAHAVADAVGDRHEAARALANLGYSLMSWARPAPAMRYTSQALAYARGHEVHSLASYVATMDAFLRLRAGAWSEAERAIHRELERDTSVAQLFGETVLAELALRRGDADASERLAKLRSQADRTNELQRVVPILALETERALTAGAPMAPERFEGLAADIRARGLVGSGVAQLAAWGAVAGRDLGIAVHPAPFSAMVLRDWRRAADAFGRVGWSYDRALMLSLLDDEEALAEAIEIARSLGAEPLVGRCARRMRDRGLRVPRGPREVTRANAAGLTPRQLEVLALVVEGLTNAEIAGRLVVSPRTTEHHVAALLAKLGVTTRREAVRRASELRLVAPS